MNKVVKFSSVILCFVLVFIPFSITASAVSSIDDVLFFVDYLYNSFISSNSSVTDFDREDFRNYVYGSDWISDNILAILFNPVGMAVAANKIDKLKDSDYQCSKLNKDQLRQLQNAGNAAVSGYGKTANYTSFADLNLQTYGGVETNGIIVQGSGGPVFYTGSDFDDKKIKQFYYFQNPDTQDICVYPGSSNSFPVIYVPKSNSLYHNGEKLPSDYIYAPLGNGELLRISYYWTGLSNFPYMGCSFKNSDSLDSVSLRFSFGNMSSSGLFNAYCWSATNMCIYKDGINAGYIGDGHYTAAGVVDRLEKMVGTRINYDGKPTIEPFELPSDIPYDDNDEVVVCVPMGDGNSGKVVYLSPTEYNNYINNGDLIQNDNRVSDYHDEQTINNISNVVNNITNNYSGSYDDTNLLNKLEKWFSDISNKLDEIKEKVSSKLSQTDPYYFPDEFKDIVSGDDPSFSADFDELINAKIPLVNEVKSILRRLQEQDRPLVIDGPNPAVALLEPLGVDVSEMKKTFSVDFSWYDKYIAGDLDIIPRIFIRNGLKYVAYAIGLAHLYYKTRSLLEDF